MVTRVRKLVGSVCYGTQFAEVLAAGEERDKRKGAPRKRA